MLSGLPLDDNALARDAYTEVEPAGIDYEGNLYFRQEGKGMLLGTYEPIATPWSVKGTPQDFGHELLEPQLDHIVQRLELGFERIPALGEAGIKDMINGPFTIGPDGNPMIGPVTGMRNYWAAVGVMVGFCQAGGVGKCLAEWMIEGEPEIDVSNDEAILIDGDSIGYVTSGGYAHHVQQSMALGYVPGELASAGTLLEVEINGEMYAATVVDEALYDPAGAKMRA